MKKYVMFSIIIMIFHPSLVRCERPAGFSVADSLYDNKLYLQAIAEYSRFLSSDGADYALYKIGLSKKEIAEFCVSEDQFDKYPEMYKKKYGDMYQTYLDYMNYIREHPGQFWYFEPAAIHVYRGTDFGKLIADYPESDFVDDSAYELLLQSRHIDWEGDYRGMLPRIDRCKIFLESYPESDVRDKVIDLCLEDYYNVLHSWEFPDSLKTKYEKEIEAFKQRWGRNKSE